jgi:hypothetical protein
METIVYTLQSGVEVEVGYITGEHQKMFSKSDGKDNEKKMLKSLIQRIGDKKTVTGDDIDKMPLADVKDLYIKMRLDNFEPEISFSLDWTDKEGNPFKHRHSVNLSEKMFSIRAAEKKVTSYQDLSSVYTVELPLSKKTVQVTRMTNQLANEKAKTVNRNDLHLNSILEWQELRYVTIDEDTKKPRLIQVNLDKMIARDIEFLRKQIILNEGNISSLHAFKNPIEGKFEEQQIDLISGIGFLFPSI